MVKKLPHEEFEPIYALDQSIDTLHGYGHLEVMVNNSAERYPLDEYHQAVRGVADQVLSEAFDQELHQARLQAPIAKSAANSRRIGRMTNEHVHVTEIEELSKEIEELERDSEALFGAELSEATIEERELIRSIIKRKIDALEAKRQAAQDSIQLIQESIADINVIVSRHIPSRLDYPRKYIKDEQPEQNSNPSLQDLGLISRILPFDGAPLLESQLVVALYPEQFSNDRPEAFRLFDAMMSRIGTINGRVVKGGDRFIQKGRLHHTDHGGKVVGKFVETVYRALRPDDLQISHKGTIEQRLEINKNPHVILWAEITPRRR